MCVWDEGWGYNTNTFIEEFQVNSAVKVNTDGLELGPWDEDGALHLSYLYFIRGGWWISKGGQSGTIWKILCISSTVQIDFSQK